MKLHTLLSRRYGSQLPALTPEAEALHNETLDTLLSHHSVRKFTDKAISDDQLALIVAAAQSASTSSSLQSWSLVVVRDPEKRARIARECGNSAGFVEVAPVFLVWVIDYARAGAIFAEAGVNTNTFDLFEATAVGLVDVGIASQNALVAAESMGLGGVYAGSLRNNVQNVVDTLGLPEHVFPVVGLALGHPDQTEGTSVKPRLPQAAVVHTDSYDSEAWSRTVPGYDQDFGAYYEQQGHPNARWSKTLVNRLSDPSILGDRRFLRDQLAAQGFKSR